MPIEYRTTVVKAGTHRELGEKIEEYLESHEKPPRDYTISPFTDKWSIPDGLYCAVIVAEIPK